MTDERSVRDALHAYATLVFARLHDQGFVLPPKAVRGSGWIASGDAFVLREYQEWQLEARHAGEGLEETTQYGHAITALRSHPLIGPRLDTTVAGWTLKPDDVLALLVSAMLSEADDLSSECFDRVFPPFYDWLARDHEDVVVIAPLSGLATDDVPIVACARRRNRPHD